MAPRTLPPACTRRIAESWQPVRRSDAHVEASRAVWRRALTLAGHSQEDYTVVPPAAYVCVALG
jgi:hypothetical protein